MGVSGKIERGHEMSNKEPLRPEVTEALRSAMEGFNAMAQALTAVAATLRETLAAVDQSGFELAPPALISDCACGHPNSRHGVVGCVALVPGPDSLFCACPSSTGGEL